MTKFQKKMITIAAAGALSAVTALPAMAFENEFHGLFNFNTVFSNYNTGASGDFYPAGLKKNNKTNNYFEQRTRLQYIAKASDDLKLVTHFEINNRWGNSNKTVAGGGAGLDTDGINIWTKWAYLDFNIGKNFNTKVGMQAYKDTLKGIFIDADLPAIMTTTKLGAYTLGLGFGRYNDDGVGRLGDRATDLFILDNTFALSKDTKLTFSYYFNADYTNSVDATLTPATADSPKLLHTFGLGGETKLAGIDLSGFAAMQAGHQKNGAGLGRSTNYHGWAANVAAKTKLGPGVARVGGLFTSGNNSDDRGHNKAWQGVLNGNNVNSQKSVQSYNESGLIILTRNTANSPSSTDQYVRRWITNVAVAYLGYDAKLTDKFNLDGGVGFAWAPSSNGAPVDKKINRSNNSDFIGTEIGLTAGYQLYKNLKLMAQGAYMINGGYYKGAAADSTTLAPKDPENPYTFRLQARYAF